MSEYSKSQADYLAKQDPAVTMPPKPEQLLSAEISLGAEVPFGSSKRKDIDSRYHEPNSYWKYILPDELIKLQRGREGLGLNHHDEHLFIVVHQAFELWFKQILFELDWIRNTMITMINQGINKNLFKINSHEDVYQSYEKETIVHLLVHRLKRAESVLRIATHGFEAMETMEPADFLEFRDYLIPASGFQSAQMREMEIMLGLKDEERIQLDDQSYRAQFETEKDKTPRSDKCPRDEMKKDPHAGTAGKCTWGENPYEKEYDLLTRLDKRQQQPSLKVTLYSWLAALDIPGVEHFVTLFLGKRQNQYEQKLVQFDEKEKLYKDLIARLSALTDEALLHEYNAVFGKDDTKTIKTAIVDLKLLLFKLGFEVELDKLLVQLMTSRGNEKLEATSFVALINQLRHSEIESLKFKLEHNELRRTHVIGEKDEISSFFACNDPLPTFSTSTYTIGEARKAVLFIMTNRWTQGWAKFSELISGAVALEQALLLWRHRHARMVELMIGRRRGTGGSSGVHYLDNTANYRLFSDLWYIRAILAPKSTFPDRGVIGGPILNESDSDFEGFTKYNIEY
jgi:tryptophan 2,3-dioxygenase